MINSTAENIEEIVNQFHEVAIDLAEHFDVLHKVSKGDLNARIEGGSEVELMEALKKVTNHMIDSISSEIIERKKAEHQIQRNLKRIKALHAIDMAITSSLDVRLTLDVVLDQVTTQLDVDAADVLLLSPYTQTLEYAAGRGFNSVALQHTRLRLGSGLAGRAVVERRIINIPNLVEAPGDLARSPLLEREKFVAYYCIPLIAKGQIKGVLEIFNREPLDPDQDWLNFFETLANQGAIAIDNADLFQNMQRSNIELMRAYDDTLEGLSHALDLRDKETEGHTQRVTEMTMRLARFLEINDAELVNMRRGALLHDIGKIGIPDDILLKPGPLTVEEREIMYKHPVFAYELLSPIAFLRPALDIPYCHHEKWDGTGYPRKLKGEGIPLSARIFAVADVWDALCSDRPYRSAWPKEKIREYMRDESGKYFDPKIAEVFLKLLSKGEI
jgi:HD-GYP domain-containing protein (c-di-GMP phosphodiesterase class II)